MYKHLAAFVHTRMMIHRGGGDDYYVDSCFLSSPTMRKLVYHNTCCIVISHDFFLVMYMTSLPVVDSGLYTNGICQSEVLLQAS
jgi:hypothetical protein